MSGAAAAAAKQEVTDAAQIAATSAPEEVDRAIELIEDAKRRAAMRAVDDHFKPSFRYVGIGSGSTIQYVVEAIKAALPQDHYVLFVPTGYQSRSEIEKHGLIALPFDSLPADVMLDVAFDGADEVDTDLNCVKGGGACLFQEKLVATRAKKFICVADFRKDVDRLLTNWPYIPIEVAPIALKTVLKSLRDLGSPTPSLRTLNLVKEGPLKTDQDFFIVKAPFPPLLVDKDETPVIGAHGETAEGGQGRIWKINELAKKIKAIVGVLEVGIFSGMTGPEAMAQGGQGGEKPIAAYFGMQDGSVKVRTAPGF